jgi:hypothetical protein
LETHGPLGTLFVGLGLGAFYIALIWINTLLGFFTTPLFIIPLTWLQDAVANRRRGGARTTVNLTQGTTQSTTTHTQASPASKTAGVPTDKTAGPPAPLFPGRREA